MYWGEKVTSQKSKEKTPQEEALLMYQNKTQKGKSAEKVGTSGS
jgi:hypothetical protein